MQTTQYCIFTNGSIFLKPGGLEFFQNQARGPAWLERAGQNTDEGDHSRNSTKLNIFKVFRQFDCNYLKE